MMGGREMNNNIKEQLKTINHQIKELSGVYRNALSRSGTSENEFWIWYAPAHYGG